MLLKIKTKIRRFLGRFFKLHRPASFPYLSGDGFRSIAHFIYDQFLDFNPKDVSYGDIIFVRTNYLKDFFEKVHPLIKNAYVLISNNEDSTVGKDFEKYIDEKIIHWYVENLNFKNDKVTVLPIGIQNFNAGPVENFIYHFEKIKKHEVRKISKILFSFTVGDIKERELANSHLSKSKIADFVKLPHSEYFEALNNYEFIASPRGGGIDCHRTWEAFYYKTIPILLRSSFSEQIFTAGFPVLLIDDWAEIDSFDQKYFADYYSKNNHKFEAPQLYLPYWYEKFINHKLN